MLSLRYHIEWSFSSCIIHKYDIIRYIYIYIYIYILLYLIPSTKCSLIVLKVLIIYRMEPTPFHFKRLTKDTKAIKWSLDMPPLIGLMPLSNAKDYMSPTLNLIHHHYRSIHKGPKNRYNPPFQIHHHGQSIGMLNGKELIYISFEILLKIYSHLIPA